MKNLFLTCVICFLNWSVFALPGGATHKNVEDLGKGLQKVTWYYDNGNVAEEGFFLNGKKHGIWTSFNEDGKKAISASWINDKKDGSSYVMYDSGKVKYHIVYSDNKKVSATEFDENGVEVASNK
jgi:antitoxin component YwqK of YwqJK toxin-antitoxin module